MEYELTVDGIKILVTKKNIKNLNLAVVPSSGLVRMSVPLNADKSHALKFATSKITWIKSKLDKQNTVPQTFGNPFAQGDEIYLWGEKLKLEFLQDTSKGKKAHLPIVIEGKLLIFTKGNHTASHTKKYIDEFYRLQLNSLLPELFIKWQDIIGVTANEVRIKDMKTRWGTCNIRDKRIWINLQLSKKPKECLEYVVVHELVHLLERSHGPKFKALMTKFLPNWNETIKQFSDTQYI